ncbi:MAG: ribonuclease P protein subunit [Candidatus Hodarchaeales archaeon]
MPGKYEEILRECYTGKNVTLIYNNFTFRGRILEETKNTFTIEIQSQKENETKLKVIPKHDSQIIANLDNSNRMKVNIVGKMLAQRPDKRIKAKIKRKW